MIVRRSTAILAVTAILTLIAAGLLAQLRFNADVGQFITSGNEAGEAWVALQDKYDTADPINVLAELPPGGSFLAKDGVLALIDLRDRLAAVPGVASVGSAVPAADPMTGRPISAEMIATAPESQVAAMLAANPLADLLVSDDGRSTMLLVTPAGDGIDLARDLDEVTPPAGMGLTFSGNPVIFGSVLDKLGWFLLVIPPIVVGLLLLVFYANIGDRRLSILALIPAFIGSVWTFGTIAVLGVRIDIVTVIVPVFVIVMGSADGLHFVTHFQEAAEATDDRVERVRSTLKQVGIPMILTTISTAAGFLSLLATDVHPIRQLGAFAAVGIVFAGVISFFSLPALLSRLEIQPHHHTAILGPKVTTGLRAVVRRRWTAPALVAAIALFAAVFLPRLEVNTDQLFFFKDGDPVREAFEKTEEAFGGATPLMGEFAFDPAAGPEQLDGIVAVSRDLEALPGIRTVFSVADLAGMLEPGQLAALMSEEVSLPLGRMVSPDGLRFMVLPEDFTTDDLRGWLDFADAAPEIRELTGMPVLWDEIARLVLRAQVGSLIAAFVLVAIMLFVSHRRLRETLASLAPIALTVGTLLAFVAASGIQLHMVTAVASSIVIGVGIDYAIHFVAAIDNARPAGDGYVLRAIDSAGRPIVANALGIAAGLTALWLSPFKVHPQISLIMWVSMLTAAATALVVIPALLERRGVAERVPTDADG
jgi:predicted RND superfamily exporter protein